MINEANYFRPVDGSGRILTRISLSDIYGYIYQNHFDMVVAKYPGYPENYSVGSFPQVMVVLAARALLDSLGLHENRMINIALVAHSNQTNRSKEYDEEKIDHFNYLADQFSIPIDYNHQRGITLMDTHHPLFYSNTNQDWIDYDGFCASLIFADRFVHELTHIWQYRLDLPTRSLWAEIAAISAGGRLLLQVLNSGRLNKKQEKGVFALVIDKAKKVYDYRDGRNFNFHLQSPQSNVNGSPVKDQTLHTEDFNFGY